MEERHLSAVGGRGRGELSSTARTDVSKRNPVAFGAIQEPVLKRSLKIPVAETHSETQN